MPAGRLEKLEFLSRVGFPLKADSSRENVLAAFFLGSSGTSEAPFSESLRCGGPELPGCFACRGLLLLVETPPWSGVLADIISIRGALGRPPLPLRLVLVWLLDLGTAGDTAVD